MCFTSLDSVRRALQTNEKLFPNFGIIFRIDFFFFIIIVALGSCKRGGGGIFVLISTRSSYSYQDICYIYFKTVGTP